MNIFAALRNLFTQAARLAVTQGEVVTRDRFNVDLALAGLLGGENTLSGINYPVLYVDFVRSCLERRTFSIREIKTDSSLGDGPSKRLTTVLDVLGTGAMPVPFGLAAEIGRIADQMAGLTGAMETSRWAGDRGLHFAMSSSLGRKGRLLFNLVRLARPERCLELGTAYGMSALFTVGALTLLGDTGRLTTVEGYDPPFSISSAMLTGRYGKRVLCHQGLAPHVLTELATSVRNVDFLFHDAGHSGESYERDFEAALPLLAPAGLVLIDDIRWEDPRFSRGVVSAYEGWRHVAAHPRVRRAVEIDDSLGLVLLT